MKKINTNKDRLESIEKRGNLIKESFQREFNKIKRIDEDYDDRDRNNPNAPWNLPDGPEFDGDFKIIDDGNNIDDLFLEIYFTGGETASISLFQILKNLKMDKYMNGWNNLLKQPHDENLHSKLTELISSYTTDPSFDGSDVDGPEQDHPTYDDGARDRMRDDKLTGDLGESEGELGDKVSRVIFKEISFNDLLNNGWPDFPLSISPKNGKIYIRVSQDGMEDWDNAYGEDDLNNLTNKGKKVVITNHSIHKDSKLGNFMNKNDRFEMNPQRDPFGDRQHKSPNPLRGKSHNELKVMGTPEAEAEMEKRRNDPMESVVREDSGEGNIEDYIKKNSTITTRYTDGKGMQHEEADWANYKMGYTRNNGRYGWVNQEGTLYGMQIVSTEISHAMSDWFRNQGYKINHSIPVMT